MDVRGIDLGQLAVSGAVPWVGGCAGLALGGVCTNWLVRRTGNPVAPRRWTTVVCLGAAGALFASVGAVDGTLGAVALMTAVVFLLYFTGAQYWLILSEAVPNSQYGSVAGAVQMFATTASIIAPAVTGYLVESPLGWTGTFGIACAVAVFGAVLLACFGRNESRLRGIASAGERIG